MPSVLVSTVDFVFSLLGGLLITFAGLALLGLRPRTGRLVAAGLIFGSVIAGISFLYRVYSLPVGGHAILFVLASVVIIRIVLGYRPAIGAAAILFGYLVMNLGSLILILATTAFTMDFGRIMASPVLYAGFAFLEHLPLITLAIFLSRRPFVLLDASQETPGLGKTLALLNVFLAQTYGLTFLGLFTAAQRMPLWQALPVGIPGVVFWVIVTALPVSAIFVLRRIDQMHRAEEELRQVERLVTLGQMAATLAHEVRNPVTAIQGYIQLAKKLSAGGNEKAASIPADFFDTSLDMTKHLEKLLEEFLILGRSPRDAEDSIDVGGLCHKVVGSVKEKAGTKRVEVSISVDREIPGLITSRKHLWQILTNLVNNAVESCDGGGAVRLNARLAEGALVLEVRDNGSGIVPERLKEIFEPFVTTKEDGTGLGLAVVAKLVRDLEGEVEVESEPGLGSLFRVTIPLEMMTGRDVAPADESVPARAG